MHRSYRAHAGSELVVGRFVSGRFLYVAVAGGVDVAPVLGSRSTTPRDGLGEWRGGSCGRAIGWSWLKRAREWCRWGSRRQGQLEPRYGQGQCGVVPGPHAELFSADAWRVLVETTFGIDPASDRMGYRLLGPAIEHWGMRRSRRPQCARARWQIPAGGRPIVFWMADGPTVGGYPVIAVVCSADLPCIAQRAPGETVRFRAMTCRGASQRAFRRRAVAIHTLAQLAKAG